MDRRMKIAEYGRKLHDKNLVIGAGGNISEKDGDILIIKKRGADMSRQKADDYVNIPFKEAQKPNAALSSETPFHVACYKARSDVGAVIHVHSPVIVAAANRTDLLEGVSYEFECVLEGPVRVINYIQPGSDPLALAVADKIEKGANAVMMRRHGALSVGKDAEEAYLRILALERACMTFLLSRN